MGVAVPFEPPPEPSSGTRRGGNTLVVESPPKAPTGFLGRLRTHVDGTLSEGATRVWMGPEVPRAVSLTIGNMELFLLDPQPEGASFAFYREPYNPRTCPLGEHRNCGFAAALFDASGKPRWSLDLTSFFSREDRLEIQDARLSGGVLFFNEACQSYSREAKGQCSSLVAVDPEKPSVLWRSPHLTSNNQFLPLERHVLTAYGFTSEKSFAYLLKREDGKVAAKVTLPSQHTRISSLGEGRFRVELYGGGEVVLEASGLDRGQPSLRLLTMKARR